MKVLNRSKVLVFTYRNTFDQVPTGIPVFNSKDMSFQWPSIECFISQFLRIPIYDTGWGHRYTDLLSVYSWSSAQIVWVKEASRETVGDWPDRHWVTFLIPSLAEIYTSLHLTGLLIFASISFHPAKRLMQTDRKPKRGNFVKEKIWPRKEFNILD